MSINFYKPHMLYKLIVLTPILVGGGCMGNKQSQNLAKHTWQSLINYETQITNKINAENAFYQTQLLNIRRGLIGYSSLQELKGDSTKKTLGNDNATTIEACDMENSSDKKTKKTLLYGRIFVSAHRDARITADSLLHSSSPKIMTAIIQVADRGIKEDIFFYQELVKREKDLSENFIVNLRKLNQEKARLKIVRDNLSKLSAEADIDEILPILRTHGEVIANELEKEQ